MSGPGKVRKGSITAFYTVLVEGDDENEPVADTMRGLLDGHVWLSRKLAGRGHYPAIDFLSSISRVMKDITTPQHQAAALTIRQLLSAHSEHEDLLSIGAYRRGTNRTVDVAVETRDAVDSLLRQSIDVCAAVRKDRRTTNRVGGPMPGETGGSCHTYAGAGQHGQRCGGDARTLTD